MPRKQRIRITSSVQEPDHQPEPVYTTRSVIATSPGIVVTIDRHTPFPAIEPDTYSFRIEDEDGHVLGNDGWLTPADIVQAHRVIGAAIEAARKAGILPTGDCADAG